MIANIFFFFLKNVSLTLFLSTTKNEDCEAMGNHDGIFLIII